MKIVLHTSPWDKSGKTLESLIRNRIPGVHTLISNDLGQLKSQLCRPMNRISAVVGVTSSVQDLDRLLTMKSLFQDTKLILILPRPQKPDMASALELNPSFISYHDRPLDDILLVLTKIKEKDKMQKY